MDDIIKHMRGTKKGFTLAGRLLFTYFAIIIVPVLILVFIAGYALQKEQVDTIVRATLSEMEEDVSIVSSLSDSMFRLEAAFNLRSDFIRLISSEETLWSTREYDTIENYIKEITEIERDIYLVGNIDNVNIYVFNEKIPERWPVILHYSRLEELGSFDAPWDFSFHGPSANISSVAEEEVVKTVYLSYYGKPYGVLQTAVPMRKFLPSLFTLSEEGEQDDYVFRLSEAGDVLSRVLPEPAYDESYDSLSSSALEKALEKIKVAEDDFGVITVSEGIRTYHIVYSRVYDPALLMLKVCPTEDILHTSFRYLALAFLLAVLVIVFVLLIGRYSIRRETKAIENILSAMEEVAKGNFDISPPKEDIRIGEVESAREAFLSLTGQLKDALEEMRKKEELLADTRIKAMQNQINVHFMTNAIESVRMQAMLNEDYLVENSLNLLGSLFRYCLRWKESFVTLKDELDYVSSYIELMNFRNDFQITFESGVRECDELLKMPKMILQPIVENAFKYSFSLQDSDGIIIIKTEEDGLFIRISVINSGRAITEEKRREVLDYLSPDVPEKRQGSGSIGLKNIQERLFSFYGPECRIDILWDAEGRTTIVIPIKKEGNENEDLDSR